MKPPLLTESGNNRLIPKMTNVIRLTRIMMRNWSSVIGPEDQDNMDRLEEALEDLTETIMRLED